MDVYVFDAKLEEWGPFVRGPASRKLSLPADRALTDLHLLIQEAFEWDDDHLYSFWLDGKFWGEDIFDFGDEWRVSLKLSASRDGGETGILERKREPPPQYPDLEDEDDEDGGSG